MFRYIPFLALVCSCALSFVVVVAPPGDARATETAQPTYASCFAEGKSHFEARDFTKAKKAFRKAKRYSENRDQKDAIKSYLSACAGAAKLRKVTTAMKKKRWRAASMMVDGLLAKYGKGPLRKLLLEDRGKIDQSLYVFLATYEDSRPTYEDTDWPADNSVTMNKDPKFVGRGSRSAKWVARENAEFMICFELATFKELDPSQFAAVELSIYNKDEDHSSFLLAFHGGDPSKLAYNDGRMYTKPCYYARITAKKRGWNQIRVEIPKGLIRNAMAEWSKCRSLILVDITSPDGSKTVYIDDVRFARH